MKDKDKTKVQLIKELAEMRKRFDGFEQSEVETRFKGNTMVLGNAPDITERRKAEKVLHDNEQRMSLHVNQTPLGVIEWDLNFKVKKWNPAAEKIFGYSQKEAIGKHAYFIIPLRNRKQVDKVWSDLLSKRGGTRSTNTNINKKGDLIYCEWYNTPLFDDKNKVLLVASLIKDITDQKKSEKKIKEALNKATESEKLKAAFLANMSHEIRTPMNSILGFSHLLADTKSKKKRLEFIRIINSNGEHLLNIINDIIDLSKIEAGIIKTENEECNVNKIIDDVRNIYEIKEKVANNKIEIIIFKGLPDIKANILSDKKRLRQILFNLLDNAYKCTERGKIEYGYTYNQKKYNSDYLEFFVRDTGRGIHQSKQEVIFNRFMQEDVSSTRTIEGTGLGLSIVKAIVQLIGGDIWVNSIYGQGSTFCFTIPYKIRSLTKGINKSSGNKIFDWRKKTILVTEDVDDSYYVIENILANTHAKIIRATNGLEAIDICRKNKKVNIVLMDIRMPIKNGYEATEGIKKFRPDLPVIAQTAYSITGDKEKAIKAGCNDYLSKPINPKHLLEKINVWFNKKVI
ncbi:ATP-binding protein [Bacteroidota bacterium]